MFFFCFFETHPKFRTWMLRQERFQDALRKRFDFQDIRDACIRDWRQTMSVPVENWLGGGEKHKWGFVTHLVRVTPVVSTTSTYLSTSLTGSTGALHEMKITARHDLSSEKNDHPFSVPHGVLVWQFAAVNQPARLRNPQGQNGGDLPNICSLRGRLIDASSFEIRFSRSSAPSSRPSSPSLAPSATVAVSGQSSEAS
jgi:hypothetical protein